MIGSGISPSLAGAVVPTCLMWQNFLVHSQQISS